MPLFLLERQYTLPSGDDPWSPPWGTTEMFLIRAADEKQARVIAQKNAGKESERARVNRATSKTTEPWLLKQYTTCEQVHEAGGTGVVMWRNWSDD